MFQVSAEQLAEIERNILSLTITIGPNLGHIMACGNVIDQIRTQQLPTVATQEISHGQDDASR